MSFIRNFKGCQKATLEINDPSPFRPMYKEQGLSLKAVSGSSLNSRLHKKE